MTARRTSSRRRTAELLALLENRRRQIEADLNDSKRRIRMAIDAGRVSDHHDGNHGELSDGLDMALVEMKSETLARIELALRRLEAGTYGNCSECEQSIPTARLQALPFAIRCTACEDARERSSSRSMATATRYAHTDLLD